MNITQVISWRNNEYGVLWGCLVYLLASDHGIALRQELITRNRKQAFFFVIFKTIYDMKLAVLITIKP